MASRARAAERSPFVASNYVLESAPRRETRERMSLDELVGMRVAISIDEPTSYIERGKDDLGEATIRRVVWPRNSLGEPYEMALLVLDKPFSGLEVGLGEPPSRTVVSITDLTTLSHLEDLISKKYATVHLSFEDPSILELAPEDPRLGTLKGTYVGWATVKVASPASG